MKSLTLFLAFSLISIFGYSQWQFNDSDIYFETGNVGIGLSNPAFKLEIAGLQDYADNQRTFIRLINHSVSHNSLVNMRLFAGVNGAYTSLSHKSETYAATANQADFGDLFSNGAGLLLRASGGVIRLETSRGVATEERMRINSDGLVGIGTDDPQAKLQVADGDIYISDITKGVIMKSPDGQCWKGTVNNDGVLNFMLMYCPGTVAQLNHPQDIAYNISISPNPTTGLITVAVDKEELNALNYQLNDLYGRIILDGKIKSNAERISIEHVLNGVYILNIFDETGNILTSEKIVKK